MIAIGRSATDRKLTHPVNKAAKKAGQPGNLDSASCWALVNAPSLDTATSGWIPTPSQSVSVIGLRARANGTPITK